jgi:3-dehydroquinate synthase
LTAAGLPTELPKDLDREALIEAMRADKKGLSGRTRLSLPRRIGEMAAGETGWTVPVGDDQLREVLA